MHLVSGPNRPGHDEGRPDSAPLGRRRVSRSARLSRAKLIRRLYEVDPLLCFFCGAEVKVLAFILDFAFRSRCLGQRGNSEEETLALLQCAASFTT